MIKFILSLLFSVTVSAVTLSGFNANNQIINATITGTSTVSGTSTYGGTLNFNADIKMANGNCIDFSATANSSGTTTTEKLCDAEQGTCTPTFTFTTTNPTSPTYGAQTCNYWKTGPYVLVQGRITYTSKGTLGVGNAQISGLPFGTSSNIGSGFFSLVQNFTTLYPNVCYITLNVCRLVAQSTVANGNDSIDYTTNMSATSDIIFSMHYMTNQ